MCFKSHMLGRKGKNCKEALKMNSKKVFSCESLIRIFTPEEMFDSHPKIVISLTKGDFNNDKNIKNRTSS